MTTLTMRQKLMSYLADADDSKVNALYKLLERDIQEEEVFTLSNEQLDILKKEREMHLSGQSKSYSRQEASQIIKGQQSF
ncbi:hypothetical protein [Mucilaginibacter ginsenosidivorax]|uniref:Addiction module protein n=1 Tax=Mucilaginibacter ginsenosidivorax TaxID=862126 RepID=A0A5B8W116_9SPHI|nr:hypothetical protein [Mucilaginibacter ginsenosidivorax]QEC75928.1 hypothetical protein FSB76_08190 [Mucilaginibacter ginsenosidivorax]